MYININDDNPFDEAKKSRSMPQIISSGVLGVSLSLLFFGILLLIGALLSLNATDGSESLSLTIHFDTPIILAILLAAIFVGVLLSIVIHKARVRALAKNTIAAQKREISLYILAGFLLVVVCCMSAMAILIAAN